MFAYRIFFTSPLWLAVVFSLYKDDYLRKNLNVRPFDNTADLVSKKVGTRKPV